jgi:glutathione peroxidase
MDWKREGLAEINSTKCTVAVYDYGARLSTGEERCIGDYRGKVLLIVNVASRCGFTRQYAGLQSLYEKFQPRGLEVLAFPCNQFGNQEPGSNADIGKFCRETFNITFPLFAKIEVNGSNAHPIYVWLKRRSPGFLGSSIKWNFTKFLIDRSGVVRSRFAPTTKPESLARYVANLL